MLANVVSIAGQREAIYVVLEAALPDRTPQAVGVLLIDLATDRGWIRMRGDYDALANPEDCEVLEQLERDMAARMAEHGARKYLESLEDSLSNVLRVSERRALAVDAFTRALDRLYHEHVENVAVEPFRTHLPLYSLRA